MSRTPYYPLLAASFVCAATLALASGPIASDFEDTPSAHELPLDPQTQASEGEQDRQAALKLFATARMMEQKDDLQAALQLYQRALRFDPQSLPIAREIVPLAFNLGRSAEAVRYALKSAELAASDSTLLQRLAMHLTTRGEFERAVAMYEQALQLGSGDQVDADAVLLSAQIAKMHVVLGNMPQAADKYRVVMQALSSDDKSVIDSRSRRAVVDDAAGTLELLGSSLGGRSKEGAAFDLIGLVLLEAGDHDAARQAFDAAKERSPQAALDAYQHALWLSRQEQWTEALDALEPYFQRGETARGMAPYELTKKILAALDRQGELIERLESHRSTDKPNAPLDLFLAEQLREAEEWSRARPLYEQARQGGTSLQAYRGLIETCRQLSDHQRLFEVLTQALGELRSVELLGDEATALLADREAVDRVLELAVAQSAASADRFDAEQLAALAQFALDADRLEIANQLYERALAAEGAKPNAIYRRWGLALLLKERYDESVEVFQKALDENTDANAEAESLFHLAGSLEMAGKTDEALQAARRAVELAEPRADELGPGYYRILTRPAWVLYHARRYPEAEAAYRELIDKHEEDHDDEELRGVLRDARLALSNLAVIRDDMPQAEEWLEQVLDEFPEDISAHNDLGYLWADQNKHLLRALGMIEKAVAADPENAAYLDSLGWIHFRLGHFDKAVEHLEAALQHDSDPDGVVLDHLGDAYRAVGDADRAREFWKRAAQAFEKAGEEHKLQEVQHKLTRASTGA